MKQLYKQIQVTHFSKQLQTGIFIYSGVTRRWISQQTGEPKKDYDLVVVGGGIIGVATAREMMLRFPWFNIAILEKEKKLAMHQSGHNSGVIHAGIYYKPKSLNARLCVEGLELTYDYCNRNKIPYKRCGKLIVATNCLEEEQLMCLHDRGIKNYVPDLQLVDGCRIKEIEPHCKGIKALWSPHTGIVDWALVTEYYAKDFTKAGGDIILNYNVQRFCETQGLGSQDYPVTIYSDIPGQKILTRNVLTCCGLQSDLIAAKAGCSSNPRIIPFRGEYLVLAKEKCHLVRTNIYPVPDPNFPFLGVHFTPRMDGSVWLGPNAVLAFKREGYRWSDIDVMELLNALRYPGFRKIAKKHYKYGLSEMSKSALISLQMSALQRYIPEIKREDVSRGPTGVRAQALDINGNLVDDFVFERCKGKGPLAKCVLHCRNAPSPGATSSLAIAKMIADKMEKELPICQTNR